MLRKEARADSRAAALSGSARSGSRHSGADAMHLLWRASTSLARLRHPPPHLHVPGHGLERKGLFLAPPASRSRQREQKGDVSLVSNHTRCILQDATSHRVTCVTCLILSEELHFVSCLFMFFKDQLNIKGVYRGLTLQPV